MINIKTPSYTIPRIALPARCGVGWLLKVSGTGNSHRQAHHHPDPGCGYRCPGLRRLLAHQNLANFIPGRTGHGFGRIGPEAGMPFRNRSWDSTACWLSATAVIVSETYYGDFQQDTPHDLYSVTKSFYLHPASASPSTRGYSTAPIGRRWNTSPIWETFASRRRAETAMTAGGRAHHDAPAWTGWRGSGLPGHVHEPGLGTHMPGYADAHLAGQRVQLLFGLHATPYRLSCSRPIGHGSSVSFADRNLFSRSVLRLRVGYPRRGTRSAGGACI